MIDINLKPQIGRIEAGVLIQCIDKDGDNYHKYGIVSESHSTGLVNVIMLNDDGSFSDYYDGYKNPKDLFGHFKIVAQKENYDINISLK